MGWIDTLAANLLASSAGLLLILALLMAATTRARTCILLFGLQSAVIAAQIAALARLHHFAEGWAVAALVVLVKVIAIPWVLLRITAALQTTPIAAAAIGPTASVFVGSGLILLSFDVVRPYVAELGVDPARLAAAVAVVLIGGLLMVTRRKALMQVVGLLVLENGIFLAALTTTLGMPLVVEIGISFDLMMWVFLMGLFVFRIRDTFDHVDVSRLRRLRG